MRLNIRDLEVAFWETADAFGGRRHAYRRWVLLPDPYLPRRRYWVPEAFHGLPEFKGEPFALAVIPP
jgi:hypothetical protein